MPITATLPRTQHLQSLSPHGFHRVVYYEWGDPRSDDVVVCVHGLARNGRDFDVLAERLALRHRVLAVDMPGRGQSEWLRDANDYVFATYLTTLTALIARAGVDTVSWVGTSMGGLLGMVLAAQPGSPIARLVVNDIGPVIEPAAFQRIAGYVGQDPSFASFAELETYIRTVSAPFGPHTDAQWRHIAATNARERPDGRWGLAYDPAIAVPFRADSATPPLWPVWDAIGCPTLVTRGDRSDLLSSATAQAMTARGPRARLVTFPEVGHAPTFMADDQVAAVLDFLDRAESP
jgi:pimeloyl-ACP methyl ester carboxylesterase